MVLSHAEVPVAQCPPESEWVDLRLMVLVVAVIRQVECPDNLAVGRADSVASALVPIRITVSSRRQRWMVERVSLSLMDSSVGRTCL